MLILLLAVALAACDTNGGGDGSGESPPPPTPPPPPPNAGTLDLSLANASALEDAGRVTFTVSRSSGSDGVVDVEVRVGSGTADPGNDMDLSANVFQFGDGDTASKTGDVLITDDAEDESDETVELELVVVSGNATLGKATAVLTIIDNDDPQPPPAALGFSLNDTGVTLCVDGSGFEYGCDGLEVGSHPGQDAVLGRDVSEPWDADGRAGFVFSKLDASGQPFADQTIRYANLPWDCVRDHITGLVWEVKTADGGLRDAAHTYRWRQRRRGEPPPETGEPECGDLGLCEVRAYIDSINAAGLCGLTNWRAPSRHELMSIVDFGSPVVASIDTTIFPNSEPVAYWSSTRDAPRRAGRLVEFDEGASFASLPSNALRLRLVSGGQ